MSENSTHRPSTTPSFSKELPIGVQDFEKLIRNNYLYIDKTELLYSLVKGGEVYFLSRPRRFGKSLLVSTLQTLFEGKRELFKGLWIDGSDYDWKPHPVIRIDLSEVPSQSAELFAKYLVEDQLLSAAQHYGVELDISAPPPVALKRLIVALAAKYGPAVVLVDEYDKPMLNRIQDLATAEAIRDVLRDFYTILKSQNTNLRFVFLTGVTKFSRVSIFLGLNNLRDISMSTEYSTLLGYTQQELTDNFASWLESLAEHQRLSREALLSKIKHWYNGYAFSPAPERVYNPFSTLLLFRENAFLNHWFETGTPTFLMTLFKNQRYDVQSLEAKEVQASAFSQYEIDKMPVLPILYQTGYLTIKAYDEDSRFYTLGYPNYEVEVGFLENLLAEISETATEKQQNCVEEMGQALLTQHWDELFNQFNRYLAQIPYDWFLKDEYYYQTIFYTLFKLTSLSIRGEVHTSLGSLDILIEHQDAIYVIEFKRNQSAKVAMKQIHARQYLKAYKGKNKPLYAIGANVTDKERAVTEWLVETLSEKRAAL